MGSCSTSQPAPHSLHASLPHAPHPPGPASAARTAVCGLCAGGAPVHSTPEQVLPRLRPLRPALVAGISYLAATAAAK